MYRATGSGISRLSNFGPELQGLGWPDLGQADPHHHDWIRDVWSVESFADAVRISTPDLAGGVDRLLDCSTPCPDRTRRICISLVKYLLRAQTRATPFGLFAGISALHIGERSAVRLGTNHRVYRPPDSASVGHADGAPASRSVGDRTWVQINGLAVVRGDRLVLPGGAAMSGPSGEVSAAMRPPLAAVLRRAHEPITLGTLTAAVRDDLGLVNDPNANTRLSTLLHSLIASTFLVTEPQAPSRPGTSKLAASVVRGPQHVEAHRDQVCGSSRTSAHQVVGVRSDAAVSIPRQVADEAAAAAAALVRLARRGAAGRAEWSDYHRRFLDRFGLGALVPLAELLHGGDGLGLPSGYHGSVLPRPPEHADAPAALVELAVAAIWERRRELVLTAADLDRITPATGVPPQPHTDLRVEIHAGSTVALDGGRFRLQVVGASRAAGTVTGRFLDLLKSHERDRLTQDYRALPTATAGARRVELCSVATNPEQAAICRAPAVLDDRIVVGAAMPGSLALPQIAVSADTAGLYLVSLHDRVPIEPTLFSALELTAHAHPVLRFLAEISAASCAPCLPFSWDGVLDGAPYVPRVRVGRSVLATARWRLADGEDLRSWQRHWQVPDRVVLCEHDRRLGLDLDESSHREVLRQAVARRGRVTLTEAPEPDAFGWIDDRPHELVITLATAHPPQHPPRPRPTSAVTTSRSHSVPGIGRWLSIELPCRPGLQDNVLLDHLPDALDGSCVWWFLRLRDPDPHLRVRVRPNRPEDYGHLARRLARWADTLVAAGVLGGPRVQTYRPETGRFGDGEALHAAEDVFVCDSAAVRAQLAACGSCDDRDALIASSMLDMAEAFLPGSGARWMIEHGPRSGPALDRTARARTIALSAPAGTALAANADGQAILAAWARRATSLAAYRATLAARHVTADVVLADLLHLHHSRAVAPSLDDERRCLRLARAAALSHRARQDALR